MIQRSLGSIAVLSFLIAAVRPTPSLHAQSAVSDTSPFRELRLPAPNAYRTGSGRPGAAYWQQQVDYQIEATLDPTQNELRGREVIHYVNKSPDQLPYLWFHLEQNICSPTSVANQLDQPPLVFLGAEFDFSCKGFKGGITIDRLALNGDELPHRVFGTTMRVDLPRVLEPGQTLTLEIAWRFSVPPYGAARMGYDGTLFEIAQWYPRLAVYDDLRGWNHEPYIGAGEFYLEYGSFDVSLTLPADYLVAATGTLQNAAEVLTAAQRKRLEQAAHSKRAVAIVTVDEAGDPLKMRPNHSGDAIWHFKADSVRDFAFAAGPNLRWDASSWNGILIHTFYRPQASAWEEANHMAREAIRHFSEHWFRYPYPQATTVEGPIEGMEYPMLTFVPNSPTREDLQWVLSHEFGHEWFPMVVGSNERFFPWMDEGFNTFIDRGGAAEYFAGQAYGDSIQDYALHLYDQHAVPGEEQPMITRPAEVRDLFWTAYQKPALMLQVLRNRVLGRERFDSAFREYIRVWAFKHPSPADFFRMMRNRSGMDLDWFWRGWIYTTARLDQAVDSVGQDVDGGMKIVLSNRGEMVMPVEMKITFASGRTELIKLPVEMWNQGPRFSYRIEGAESIRSVELDPDHALPDTDRRNNYREARAPRP
ncbi:MAG: M1 family metallopeptidase [Gemmatimonadales bacterium]